MLQCLYPIRPVAYRIERQIQALDPGECAGVELAQLVMTQIQRTQAIAHLLQNARRFSKMVNA